MHVTKRLNLPLLEQELAAASVSVNGLGHHGTDTDGEVFTYQGADIIDLPPAAQPVVDAHVAPSTITAYTAVTVSDVRTTTATQTTLVAWPLAVQTLYTARFTIMAVDTGNGDCRVWYAKASAKRLGGGALLVGVPNIDTDHPNPGATSWVLTADTSGSNFRVRITGAAGRTISWNLVGEVLRARPDGLVD
jgi:hypothetical protein